MGVSDIVKPSHNGPGQIQQLTPLCDEHVPDRFCEQLKALSLQTAVAVPHGAAIGDGTVQMFDPGGGVGIGGVGVGVGVGVGLAIVPMTSVEAALVPQALRDRTRA